MYKVTKRDCPMFGIGPYVCEFICDTASDITTLPTSISEGTGGRTAYDNQKCASGSIAIVASGSDSKQYMLNNQDIWCPYSVAAGSSSGGSGESSVTVDFALSETSENPVANKAITAALNNKADASDIPTKVSELENDSGYLTEHPHINEIPGAIFARELQFGDSFDSIEQIVTDGNGHIKEVSGQTLTLPYISIENSLDIHSGGLLTNKTITAALNEKADASDIPDLTLYAKKTDVPGIKVNAAVNADTVGGKSADDFAQIINLGANQTDTKTAVSTSTKTTIYNCSSWTDYPAESPDGQGIIIAVNYNGSGIAGTDAMWAIQFFISARTGAVYKRYIGNSSVGSWKETSTTPIKSTDIFGSTDQYGNLLLWKVTDARKPILVTMNGFYVIPFLTSDSDYYYYYAGLINCTTHEYISNTPVSGTIYYIDG